MSNRLTAAQQLIYGACINTSHNILYYGPGASGKTLVLHMIVDELCKTKNIVTVSNTYNDTGIDALYNIFRSATSGHEWDSIDTILYITPSITKLHIVNILCVFQMLQYNCNMFGKKRLIIECAHFDGTYFTEISSPEASPKYLHVYNIEDHTDARVIEMVY